MTTTNNKNSILLLELISLLQSITEIGEKNADVYKEKN